MTSDQFVQWLKGFLDAVDGKPSPAQVATIKKKLGEVKAAPVEVVGAGPRPMGRGFDFGAAQLGRLGGQSYA